MNPIERFNKEVKRRADVIGIFRDQIQPAIIGSNSKEGIPPSLASSSASISVLRVMTAELPTLRSLASIGATRSSFKRNYGRNSDSVAQINCPTVLPLP